MGAGGVELSGLPRRGSKSVARAEVSTSLILGRCFASVENLLAVSTCMRKLAFSMSANRSLFMTT